jgi:isocitrate lyase
MNLGMYELALLYRENGMAAYSNLQQAEFAYEAQGYRAGEARELRWNGLLGCGRENDRGRRSLNRRA